MTFLIVAVIQTDVDSQMHRYLNAAQDGWVPTEEGAFVTAIKELAEGIFSRLMTIAKVNEIANPSTFPVSIPDPTIIQKAFDPAKGGRLYIIEKLQRSVMFADVNLTKTKEVVDGVSDRREEPDDGAISE